MFQKIKILTKFNHQLFYFGKKFFRRQKTNFKKRKLNYVFVFGIVAIFLAGSGFLSVKIGGFFDQSESYSSRISSSGLSGFGKYSGTNNNKDGIALSACGSSSYGTCSGTTCVSSSCTVCDTPNDVFATDPSGGTSGLGPFYCQTLCCPESSQCTAYGWPPLTSSCSDFGANSVACGYVSSTPPSTPPPSLTLQVWVAPNEVASGGTTVAVAAPSNNATIGSHCTLWSASAGGSDVGWDNLTSLGWLGEYVYNTPPRYYDTTYCAQCWNAAEVPTTQKCDTVKITSTSSCTASCGSCSASCGGGTQTCKRTDCTNYTQNCNTQSCCTSSCPTAEKLCKGKTCDNCGTIIVGTKNCSWREVAP